MIEEYARHNGHADLLRQSLDSETGESVSRDREDFSPGRLAD
jgi:Protein of unknown function (DUF664)